MHLSGMRCAVIVGKGPVGLANGIDRAARQKAHPRVGALGGERPPTGENAPRWGWPDYGRATPSLRQPIPSAFLILIVAGVTLIVAPHAGSGTLALMFGRDVIAAR